jgi:endonuclease/exonuclease/phosphatase family metal-dependent hydrolase
MILVNTMPGMCTGGPTRIQVREDGTQQSTLDYVMCTPDLALLIKSLKIHDGTMGSDHRPLTLMVEGCTIKPPANEIKAMGEV